MKRFKADDLVLDIPTSWNEVTLHQFYELTKEDAPTDSIYVISTLASLTPDQLRKSKAYDLDSVILEHIQFIYDSSPDLQPGAPTSITIDGKTIVIPSSIDKDATLGQMTDIKFVIQKRQSDKEPVNSAVMAPVLLTVFLWPYLRNEPYTDWHEAGELWDTVSKMNCIDGLRLSAFFLRNSLSPSPSGKVSEIPNRPTLSSVWQRLGFRASRTSKPTTPQST
ncbi:hypothetical protein WBJ53_14945 [Spirosoma sp. SC4-14]|uniref:hypothetical protein n=1 Tax=Spirosoma sp. SC4-14 TaxID=3128900 RepID=UPI0030D3F7D7